MSKPIDPQAALESMWKTAPLLAKAKAERVYLEEYRKSLKAILMKGSNENSAVMQEREAYAHPDYISHLAGLQAAVEQEETLKWRMIASQAAVEIWRSQEASNRNMDRSSA
jgi:hypothetical protein